MARGTVRLTVGIVETYHQARFLPIADFEADGK